MASLPNKSFVFNFNARDYNTQTYTIPNEGGASMNIDMVITAATTTVRNQVVFDEDHITVPTSAISIFDFSTTEENPLNITEASQSLTVVFKQRKISWANFLGSRIGVSYPNWIIRMGRTGISFHSNTDGNTDSSKIAPYDTGSVVMVLVRVNNLSVEIKNLTTGESNTPFNTTKTGAVSSFSFFATRASNSSLVVEPGSGDFYWCYCSREVLTDEEIQQVIDFNESKFGLDEESADVPYSGGVVSVNLSAEGVSWTASTANNWITISPATGTGDSVITLTVKNNNFGERTGTVTFTSGAGDEAEFTINQGGTDGLFPYNKIYRNGRRVN